MGHAFFHHNGTTDAISESLNRITGRRSLWKSSFDTSTRIPDANDGYEAYALSDDAASQISTALNQAFRKVMLVNAVLSRTNSDIVQIKKRDSNTHLHRLFIPFSSAGADLEQLLHDFQVPLTAEYHRATVSQNRQVAEHRWKARSPGNVMSAFGVN